MRVQKVFRPYTNTGSPPLLLKNSRKPQKFLMTGQHDENSMHCALLFYHIEPLEKGPFLVLPSSIARNSSERKTKRIFEIQRGILEDPTNRARPTIPALAETCQNGTV